jgi:hypothetical protein
MRMSERGAEPQTDEYSIVQCLEELAFAEHFSPAERGAMITAAKKRLKAHIVMQWLTRIAVEHDLDMTPTMAFKFVRAWLGRCAARPAISARFGVPGRSASTKSEHHGQVLELANFYKDHVLNDINAALVQIRHG